MALVWDFSTLASTTSQMMYMEHETALKQNDTSMPPMDLCVLTEYRPKRQ